MKIFLGLSFADRGRRMQVLFYVNLRAMAQPGGGTLGKFSPLGSRVTLVIQNTRFLFAHEDDLKAQTGLFHAPKNNCQRARGGARLSGGPRLSEASLQLA